MGGRRVGERGQGLVEFSMLVPAFLLILMGMLEFGFAFNHNLTLNLATREGARAGAAMADGSQIDTSCGAGTTITAANVDPLVIAAVQRVLESPGSMIDISQVQSITIY
jgi:Flp pilus assembly protein TadG